MNRYIEKLEEQLERDLAEGRISQKDFNDEIREIGRAARAEAEDAAMDAYRDRMGDFGYY